MSHFKYLNPNTAVSTIMIPQNTEEIQTGMSGPFISTKILEKEAPAILLCMPNHPKVDSPITNPTINLAPFSPKLLDANETVAFLFSTAAILNSDIKSTTKLNPINPAHIELLKLNEAINVLPTNKAGTLTIPPNHIPARLYHLVLF